MYRWLCQWDQEHAFSKSPPKRVSSSKAPVLEIWSPFITITPKSTLTWRSTTCQGSIYGSNRSTGKLLVFDWNGWNHMILHTLSYLPNPSTRAGYDTRSIFKWSLTGLNSEFSFSYTSCLTKAAESSLPYYLPISGGRTIGFIPFPRVLRLCEMQSVKSRIWTRVAVSNSRDDNHYTTILHTL